MRKTRLLALFLFAAACAVAELPDRPNFTGKWTSDNTKLDIRQDADSIQITEEGANPDSRFSISCGTKAKECPMMDRGHKAVVRVWYNGPKLVVFKTDGRKGAVATKRRFTMAPSGDSFEMEIMPIDPPGDTKKLSFRKAEQ
jgi:hypothetical protein